MEVCLVSKQGYDDVGCEYFFFHAEDDIRDYKLTGVQTCALPISTSTRASTPRGSSPSRSRTRPPTRCATASPQIGSASCRDRGSVMWVAESMRKIIVSQDTHTGVIIP